MGPLLDQMFTEFLCCLPPVLPRCICSIKNPVGLNHPEPEALALHHGYALRKQGTFSGVSSSGMSSRHVGRNRRRGTVGASSGRGAAFQGLPSAQ